MERHSFSINYNVSKEKKRKDGSIPIHATINLNGIRASFSTGRKVLFEDWDNKIVLMDNLGLNEPFLLRGQK